MHCGTAPDAKRSYTLSMQLEYVKLVLAASWMSVVCVAGLAAGLHSPANWTVLAGVAMLPSIVLMRHWNHPGQTLSESIQEARQ